MTLWRRDCENQVYEETQCENNEYLHQTKEDVGKKSYDCDIKTKTFTECKDISEDKSLYTSSNI